MSMLHALLIGIDGYARDRLPGGTPYPSLQGATRDVEHVESFLRDQAGLTPERTRKLLSRSGKNRRSDGRPEQLPTYTNIVAVFKQLAAEAAPGDRVYVHYSGHGTRLKTEYGEVKGPNGKDEALVPCDLGEPGFRYLRDLELAVLVRLLVDHGLLVTLVLDCCHAGGAMRHGKQGGPVARQVPEVPLPQVPSAVAPRDLLMRAWRRLRQEEVRKRNLSVQSWLPVARYVLFAACRPDELAFEVSFEPGEPPQGALTYWLLDALRQSSVEQSCDAIQKRLVAGVHGSLKQQTPIFVGDGDRPFLGEAPVRRPRPTVPGGPMVLRVDEKGRVLLGWGQALGASEGARLILRAPSGEMRALLEVRQAGSSESWAEVVGEPGPPVLPPGAHLEVLPLQAVVRLLPPDPAEPEARQALDQVREALWSYRGGCVEIDDEAGTPDLCVAFAHGRYEILNPDGLAFPNLAPLRAGRGAALELVRRLDHLARFRSLRTLENLEHPDWLEIGLELCSDDPSVAPVPVPAGGLDLRCGDAAILRIVNRSTVRLDFAVLDLTPDFSVEQVLPPRKSFSLLPLDSGEAHVLRMRAWLPDGLQEGTDILKVIATRGTVSFRWLELPPLGRPAPERTLRGELTPSKVPEEEWISKQVEIRIRR